jgi:hypothetical protein
MTGHPAGLQSAFDEAFDGPAAPALDIDAPSRRSRTRHRALG